MKHFSKVMIPSSHIFGLNCAKLVPKVASLSSLGTGITKRFALRLFMVHCCGPLQNDIRYDTFHVKRDAEVINRNVEKRMTTKTLKTANHPMKCARIFKSSSNWIEAIFQLLEEICLDERIRDWCTQFEKQNKILPF